MMLHKTIRVHRRDSAFVYAILESLEGVASYSTLDGHVGQDFRDLRLNYTPEFAVQLEQVLDGMRKKFTILELPNEPLDRG